MRFNNRFCALMDIPDLPIGAFEHIGDRKIKPQGGGGGGIVSAITDPISSALGTDGGGGGVLGALADVDPGPALGSAAAAIDPGPAIGDALAEVDKGVNQIPGGWYTVGGLAAGGTGLYFAPEIMAAVGAEAGTAITTEAGQAAFFDALASGATGAEAVSTGLSVDALASGAASFVTPDLMGPTYSELAYTGLPEGALGPTYTELGYTGVNQAQAIAAADAAAAPGSGLMGPTYQELGVTGLPEGAAGPTYAELGYTGLNTSEAVAAADAAAAAAKAGTAISPMQALQGLRMASGLLGAGRTPQQAQMQAYNPSRVPQGAVDYSPILSLLNIQQAQRNKNSLLG